MRIILDGQSVKMDYLVQREWKALHGPPQRLWTYICSGVMSLLQVSSAAPDGSAGLIGSSVLKTSWSFHSGDINHELLFRRCASKT